MNVHPVAALLPMMSDEELDDLASDIQVNGLIHPIIMDGDTLIDGRNRLAACQRIGYEPPTEELGDRDPVALILSANIARRHMTVGQRAMAVARSRLFATNNRQVHLAESVQISRSRVAYADVVLEHAPDMADEVMAGSRSLDDAYKTAQQRKAAAKTADASMARLRAAAPDLADMVTEEQLALAEALAVLETRKRDEQDRRRAATSTFGTILIHLSTGGLSPDERAARWAENIDPALHPEVAQLTIERLRESAAVYAALCERLQERFEHGETATP